MPERLLVLNQYFPPDRAATGQLLGQLCEGLAEKYEVTVLCGTPTYAPGRADPDTFRRIRVVRIPLLSTSRTYLAARLVNYGLYLTSALLRSLFLPRPDVVMAWTDPPLIGLVGVVLRRLRGSRLVFVSQDVYPEIALAVGRMNGPLAVAMLRWATGVVLRHVDAVVALSESMKGRLTAKGCAAEKIRIVANWHDMDRLRSMRDSAFRDRHGLPRDAFVVMHSGNIGLSQDFDSLLAAAEITRNEADIVYAVIGDGSRRAEVESRVLSTGLQNVRLFPYQADAQLGHSLGAADLHYVSLRPDLEGLIVPSKVYGILAVGRPILAVTPEGCEVTRIVRQARCGSVCSPGGEAVAAEIRRMKARPKELDAMGRSGREWAEKNGGRDRAVSAYAEILSGRETS